MAVPTRTKTGPVPAPRTTPEPASQSVDGHLAAMADLLGSAQWAVQDEPDDATLIAHLTHVLNQLDRHLTDVTRAVTP